MSKIIIIAVFIFWSALSFFYARSLFQPTNFIGNNFNNLNAVDNATAPSSLVLELPNHNTRNNCWLLIAGKIYNVTSYINSHPGGAAEIIKYCGQDASVAFASKDKSNPQNHSADAYAFLASYYIGEANSPAPVNISGQGNVNLPSVNNNSVPIPSAPAPVTYTLTTALVAQHNSPADCWATVGTSVYNVTSYINAHPGGSANITKYCGADMGAAFSAQGHSANATSILASFKIGTIGSAVSSDTINSNIPVPINNNSNSGDDDEEEEEDDD